MLTVGSLFSGIGGFDLGLERAGMRIVWQCEQDAYCRRVLARHWPGVPCHPDVRALVADAPQRRDAAYRATHGTEARADNGTRPPDQRVGVPVPVPYVDVLCGGFPCQDLSVAGKGAGIDGARSGLWSEYARLIGELRPRYVIVENVSALLARGMGRVLGDLAALGYDAEWDCLPASAFGAPHRRDRVWLVAYPALGDGVDVPRVRRALERQPRGRIACDGSVAPVLADAARLPEGRAGAQPGAERQRAGTRGEPGDVADAEVEPVGTGLRESGPRGLGRGRPGDGGGAGATLVDAGGFGCGEGSRLVGRMGAAQRGWWESEPDVGRVAHGIPTRVDRLRSLGNALVPQIAEWIGRRILTFESGRVSSEPARKENQT